MSDTPSAPLTITPRNVVDYLAQEYAVTTANVATMFWDSSSPEDLALAERVLTFCGVQFDSDGTWGLPDEYMDDPDSLLDRLQAEGRGSADDPIDFSNEPSKPISETPETPEEPPKKSKGKKAPPRVSDAESTEPESTEPESTEPESTPNTLVEDHFDGCHDSIADTMTSIASMEKLLEDAAKLTSIGRPKAGERKTMESAMTSTHEGLQEIYKLLADLSEKIRTAPKTAPAKAPQKSKSRAKGGPRKTPNRITDEEVFFLMHTRRVHFTVRELASVFNVSRGYINGNIDKRWSKLSDVQKKEIEGNQEAFNELLTRCSDAGLDTLNVKSPAID